MQVRAQDLESSLARGLGPVYLIAGDETLLVEEACDLVLGAARREGFAERVVLHVEPGFKWHGLIHEAASLSLFTEKKILDLRVPPGKFDKQASETLRGYLRDRNPDNLLLIRTGRLQARQRAGAWYKAIDAAGAVVPIWPIGHGELPGWLRRRARIVGVSLTSEAVAWLADRVEGNLLAAAQEIDKLKLADLRQPIDAETLLAAVSDAAHYDAFELVDVVFAGEARRVRRVLATLRDEGVPLFSLLGALTSQLRAIGTGQWMPPQRKRQIPAFLKRTGPPQRAVAQIALIDQQAKGGLHGDAWVSFERLLMRLCGVRLPSLEREMVYLRRCDPHGL